MKRALIVAPLLAAGLLAPMPAEAATPLVPTGYSYSPLNDRLAAAIRTAPCKGGRVDVVIHNTGDWTLTKAVLDAARCGVKVRVVTWYKKNDATGREGPLQLAQTQMRDAVRASGGVFVACHGACLRNGSAGVEHEKVVLIANGRQHLVISDSGNWTDSNDDHENDRMTVDDRCLYDGSLAHVDQLAKDRAPKKPIRHSATCDGTRRIYWMPVANYDPTDRWARTAKCGKGARIVWSSSIVSQGKKSKYGSGDRIITALIRAKAAGADVRATTNKAHWSRALEARLVKGGVRVTKETDGYHHLKMLATVGCKTGPFLSQGSTTTNVTAMTKNGNQVFTSTRDADATAALQGYYRMIR